jgi:hypothetical protein
VTDWNVCGEGRCRYQPSLRGVVVVAGAIMGGHGGGSRSASSCLLRVGEVGWWGVIPHGYWRDDVSMWLFLL